MKSGQTVRKLTGHTSYVLALVILPDGTIASASYDTTIKIWNKNNGKALNTLHATSEVWSLALMRDETLACGCQDTQIRIWNTTTGLIVKTLSGHTGTVLSLTVLNDGSLVSGSDYPDATIRIWSENSIKILNGHTSSVLSLAVLPDGRLASGILIYLKFNLIKSNLLLHFR